jgi:hypothetical protein
MADLSRRNFLTKASLGVVAGVAASSGLAIPGLFAPAAPEAESAATGLAPLGEDLVPLGEDLVALVRNASTGEVAVMSGLHEVVFEDPQLVGRLLQAARQVVSKE